VHERGRTRPAGGGRFGAGGLLPGDWQMCPEAFTDVGSSADSGSRRLWVRDRGHEQERDDLPWRENPPHRRYWLCGRLEEGITECKRTSDPNQRRHFGPAAPRLTVPRLVHRGAHRRYHAGDRDIGGSDDRAALHGKGHARAVGPAQRTASKCDGERRRDPHQRDSASRPACRLVGDPEMYNRAARRTSDGMVALAHPPEDGGFKLHPRTATGDIDVTDWIQSRATTCCGRERRRQAGAVRDRGSGGDDAPHDLSRVRQDLKTS